MKTRAALALLLPFCALALQWVLWPWIKPFVWFLFFPAVFFSARLGGLRYGMISSVISCAMVWFYFMQPQLSWNLENPYNLCSIVMFLLMGYLFSDSQERLQRAQRDSENALETMSSAKQKITELYLKTVELDNLKSQFFTNVSHELRTPLTLIISPLMRRLALPDRPTAERNEDQMMLRNARQLYRHVCDLLDSAKLESGRMSIDYARFDLTQLTRAIASQFEIKAQDSQINYRLDLPERLEIEADGEKLERILLNLLSNAFKFTPEGGRIQLRLRQTEQQATLEVLDNGPGVPPHLRTAVFERFRQGKGGLNRRFGGTGLGLAIVKEFTELHGGRASVDLAPGGGALFSISLPLHAPANTAIHGSVSQIDPLLQAQAQDELASPPSHPQPPPSAPPDAALILVVEDNPDMRAFICDALRSSYDVVSAEDGEQGVERALEHHPDLILSDLMMPRMDGERMVTELRRHPELNDTPIVMLSAKADEGERARLLNHGAQDYLEKPFAVNELLARIGGLIRERRRMSARVQSSELRFEATFDQAAMGIALLTPDGQWLRVNRKLCQILGFSQETLLTKSFHDMTDPRDLDVDLNYVRQVLAGDISSYTMEKRYRHASGAIIWASLSVALVRKADGSPDYFISVVEDIQQRKTVELALLASEANLKAAQQLAKIGNWDWDIASNQHRWSEEIYLIYGRDPKQLPAIYPEVQQYFTPDSWARLAAAVESGLAEGQAYECDAEVVRPDGTHRWITARGAATRDAAHNIVALNGTVQDITERKQAEEDIRRLNNSLEIRVQQRTQELTQANHELDSFAYAVSHDLRAPLRAMSGFSQALIEDYGAELQNEARDYLNEIDQASRKMGELIDGILQLSRSTRGEMRRDPLDISTLARHLLEEMARGEPERQVDWRIAPNLTVYGDSRMIEAVLRNLLGNAWKYTSHTANAQIRVEADDIEQQHGICIRDNGAGFDMAHAELLFQPFRRLHRQDEFPGIGIGLATVQRIIHRHGGELRAQGSPGGGATFCFTLPEAPKESTP